MNKQPCRQTENPAGGASGVFGSACGGCGHHPPSHCGNNHAVISFQKISLDIVMTAAIYRGRRRHIQYAVTVTRTTRMRQPRNPPRFVFRAAAGALRCGQSPPHRLRTRLYGATGAAALNDLPFGSGDLPMPSARTAILVNLVGEFGFGNHGRTRLWRSYRNLDCEHVFAGVVGHSHRPGRKTPNGPSPPSSSLAVNSASSRASLRLFRSMPPSSRSS